MNPIKILILTANPDLPNQAPLRLDAEVRLIEEALRRSQYRERFQVATKLAIRPTDLRRALLDYRPHIIHFSGHGTGERGLVLETDTGQQQMVRTEALTQLFEAFESGEIGCVLLNACYSDVQATAIHQFVDCVIGMDQPIGDQAAVQFAEGFYDALGAGRFYDEAFKIGCSAIALAGGADYSIPVLKYRKQPGVLPLGVMPLGDRAATESAMSSLSASAAQPGRAAQSQPQPQPQSQPQLQPQSQSIGNVTISGSNNPFNAVQAGGNVTLNQSQTQTTVTNSNWRLALEALGQLKQAIASTDALDETDKAMAAIPMQKLETELQTAQPDRSVVDKMIATLKKTLDGVITLAEPMTKVAMLVAKAWAGLQ